MFNDVVYFKGKKLNLFNKNVGNLIYSLTGIKSYAELKKHFVDFPCYIDKNGNYACSYSSCLDLSDYRYNGFSLNFEVYLIIDSKSGEVMISDLELLRF